MLDLSACVSSLLSKISLPRKAHPLVLNTASMPCAYGWLPILCPQIPRQSSRLWSPKCLVALSTQTFHKHLKLNMPQTHPYPVVIIPGNTYPRTQIRNKKHESTVHPLHSKSCGFYFLLIPTLSLFIHTITIILP